MWKLNVLNFLWVQFSPRINPSGELACSNSNYANGTIIQDLYHTAGLPREHLKVLNGCTGNPSPLTADGAQQEVAAFLILSGTSLVSHTQKSTHLAKLEDVILTLESLACKCPYLYMSINS